MHGFPALPQPLRWYLGLRARRLNQALRRWVEQSERCEFVPIDFPLRMELMASDGFHPGADAYSMWAGQLAGVIRRRQEPGGVQACAEEDERAPDLGQLAGAFPE